VLPRRSPSTRLGKGFLDLVRAIVAGDARKTARLVENSPTLVHARSPDAATRQSAEPYFSEAIAHYLYAAGTALHMAAAGFKPEIAQAFIDRGADCSAKQWRALNLTCRAPRPAMKLRALSP
jgi:hypothetical protein